MEKVPLHLLEALVTFGDSRNIAEAARTLGLSQPGLSKQLQQLEQRLPGKVFTLRGRRKELTPYGLALHRLIRDKIGNIQDIAREAWNLNASASGSTLRIWGRRGILDRLSGQLKFSGTLIFSESSNTLTLSALESRRADLGIVHTFPNSPELVAKPLFREEFQLVVPRKLVSRPPKLGAELMRRLAALPCLAYRPHDELTQALLALYSLNTDIRLARATDSYPSIREMAAAQMGWAVLPKYIHPPSDECWSLAIPAKALPSRQFFLAYRSEFRTVDWFRDLVSEAQRCFR